MSAYFLTFSTYGTRLPGDKRSSVDRANNIPGTPTLPPHAGREHAAREAMTGKPVVFSSAEREIVDGAIRHVCERRNWALSALNVRSNHVHVVVAADANPNEVLIALKAYSSRFLADAGLREPGARIWTVHGSTRWLNTEGSVEAAVNYVLFEQ